MENLINTLYTDFSNISKSNIGKFGFKERMKIERSLFLILKEISPIDFQGFSEINNANLESIKDQRATVLIKEINSLRIFLKKISSSNPYERYDAMNETNMNRFQIFSLINKKINKLINNIKNYR